MKKNSYYFSLLSEVEQGQFRENYEQNRIKDNPESFEDYLNNKSGSFKIFVAFAFYWNLTPIDQKWDYWMKNKGSSPNQTKQSPLGTHRLGDDFSTPI